MRQRCSDKLRSSALYFSRPELNRTKGKKKKKKHPERGVDSDKVGVVVIGCDHDDTGGNEHNKNSCGEYDQYFSIGVLVG